MRNYFSTAVLLLLCFPGAAAAAGSTWRAATDSELKQVIPARAPVENERIETETRTESGITNGEGQFIAGAVLITAGYSAEGKYSHFLVVQSPVQFGDLRLEPGDYVFGFKHEGDGLNVKLYHARTGQYIGSIRAERQNRTGRIESFRIVPAGDHGLVMIGRFGFPYRMPGK